MIYIPGMPATMPTYDRALAHSSDARDALSAAQDSILAEPAQEHALDAISDARAAATELAHVEGESNVTSMQVFRAASQLEMEITTGADGTGDAASETRALRRALTGLEAVALHETDESFREACVEVVTDLFG